MIKIISSYSEKRQLSHYLTSCLETDCIIKSYNYPIGLTKINSIEGIVKFFVLNYRFRLLRRCQK